MLVFSSLMVVPRGFELASATALSASMAMVRAARNLRFTDRAFLTRGYLRPLQMRTPVGA
jgi:hypothetical protein